MGPVPRGQILPRRHHVDDHVRRALGSGALVRRSPVFAVQHAVYPSRSIPFLSFLRCTLYHFISKLTFGKLTGLTAWGDVQLSNGLCADEESVLWDLDVYVLEIVSCYFSPACLM